MKQNSIAVILLVAVITAGGGFFAGMKYQQTRRVSGFTQMMNGQGGRNMMFGNGNGNGNTNGTRSGMRNGFRPVAGEIIKQDDTSITVKMQDGSTKIVLVSGTTAINKATTGTKSDLTTGTQVAVFGSENSDGSVTAQNIQLNPVLRGQATSPTPAK